MQQKISDKYRRVPANGYVIAAVVISSLLHASAAAWWLSRQAQMVEMPGVQEVTVSLISPEPPAPEPVAVPLPAPPEPELLSDDEMAEKHKIIKKKPPVKKPQPQPLQEQPKISVPVAESKPAPAPVTTARYDADYLNNTAPDYPQLSRRLGEEGQVMVRAQVSADGKVFSVELKQSSGFERLDEAALKAVAKYRFTSIGRVSFVIVPIKFNLKK